MQTLLASRNEKKIYFEMMCSDFYAKSTVVVARDLLGKTLVRLIPSDTNKTKRISGIIVETEAYGFTNDPASHAYRGLTVRNSTMFGDVGRAYIYFTYGSQFCVNVSARSSKVKAGSVLIRALQPLEGIDKMMTFRKTDDMLSLTSGPGKLSQALNINLSLNGYDVTDPRSELHIEYGINPASIVETSRIGISRGIDKKWRFIIADNMMKGHLNKYASRRNF
jgi:DNA-3-methyladenine glycosylase